MKLSDCPQLVIYITFSVLGFFSSYLIAHKYIKDNEQHHLVQHNRLGHLVGFIVVCALLYWLCSTGHNVVAWVLLLFPFILMTVLLVFIVLMVSFKKLEHQN